MKFLHLRKFIPSILILSAFLTTDCDDKWDEHYNQKSADAPDYNLKEYIDQSPELSIFNSMLQSTGYDEVINSAQSYTVWAPMNDALSGIDLNNSDLVLEIVQNHITRGKITTSDIDVLPVRMLSGKFVEFSNEGDGYKFGENNLVSSNSPSINGLVHATDGYVPYVNNLWEFVEDHDNLDSLHNYLSSQTEFIFDTENSIEIGVDDEGHIIYDTAFIYSNPVLEELGTINIEDSIYTAIMPDNTAWIEAYNRIESYFNFPMGTDSTGPERKRAKTQYTLVQDMLYRGRIEDPALQTRMVSTGGNTFYNPESLYTDVYETADLSNGIANVTSQMPFSDTASWYKEIKVEAEELEGREKANCNVFPRTSYGSGLDISDDKYILVDPTAAGASVSFSIPNTLSAKYNMYCVFVPASIADPNDFTPTKVKFKLTYIYFDNGSIWHKEITPDVNTTFPIGLTKMFVEQFDFEFANFIDDDYENVAVKLEVINDVSSAEEQAGTYSRTMRIDCVIFEPVY